ncbi:unnamed protein product [Chironomus riparius]|uniref:Fatty acid 2-hydroxylase n=1 Tax=Chironomus riparius TaxID=315576 RepID=A0A9N9RZ76_9DIPT|nr:unnamed protein product [Chironomus riparius]
MEVGDKSNEILLPVKSLIVEYEKELYDLKKFIHQHPGGINILQHKNYKNIDANFKNSNHSLAAKYLLKEYKIRSDVNNKEGLEHLVDWNKAMVPQISKLDKNYYEWVNLPVDRPLKLFEYDLLEIFTKTPWYLPLLFWIPVIVFFIINESSSFLTTFEMYLKTFIWLGMGICLWTLLEYILHRFVFHINVLRYPRLKTFHFMFHGNHHKVPFDEYRLVFPPIPAAILTAIGYQLLRVFHYFSLISQPKLLLAGILIGFLGYDMTHYYLHFASPKNAYFYNLKRYHYKHHFVSHEKGFGVSNTFWDRVFSTEIQLNKLKYLLKWKE